MNPLLSRLQPYPFERLRALFSGIVADASLTPLDLSIGEPKHATPAFIREVLAGALDGLSTYPRTAGSPELRHAIARWLARRYAIPAPDPETQVLPVNGSREALFAFAQTVVDPSRSDAVVLSPNPFYQIYEGAALLAGARPAYAEDPLAWDDWTGVQLLYVCSPANPTGKVLSLEEWKGLFALSDRHGFVIASDECYSELYYDEGPPVGALEAAHRLGRDDYRRLVVFSSLSKRSNVPGMRSGFVAGDAALLKAFLLYRTYHGSAMSVSVQKASEAAWADESHVEHNRRLYAEKFRRVVPMLDAAMDARTPQGGFYLWLRTPIDDAEFARRLYRERNVVVLPGSFLAREVRGHNPGAGRIRVALVPPLEGCIDAARRIADFARNL